jgi:hypothetical protein
MVNGPDHRVIMMNNPARRLLPMAYSEPVDMTAWEVIATADLASYVRQALEEDRGAPMRDFTISHRNRDFILSCGVLPWLIEDESSAVWCILRMCLKSGRKKPG